MGDDVIVLPPCPIRTEYDARITRCAVPVAPGEVVFVGDDVEIVISVTMAPDLPIVRFRRVRPDRPIGDA